MHVKVKPKTYFYTYSCLSVCDYCVHILSCIIVFCVCVCVCVCVQVLEVHQLLDKWRPITMEVALELLDYHFADEKVRTLAVRRLEKLANDELQNFLLQLVQVRKLVRSIGALILINTGCNFRCRLVDRQYCVTHV